MEGRLDQVRREGGNKGVEVGDDQKEDLEEGKETGRGSGVRESHRITEIVQHGNKSFSPTYPCQPRCPI